MKSNLIRVILGLFAISVAGCGGGGDSSPVVSNQTVASMTVAGGNNQTATVGTELPEPLVALVLDQAGQPIAGQVVNFKIVTGDGTVFAGATISDADGHARERWTLGTTAGPQKVEVRAVDANGAAVVYATFDAMGTAGAPQIVSIASGNGQRSQQLQPLPEPLKVIVSDAYGNLKAGVSVAFMPNDGGKAFPETVLTDIAGEASAAWTLGQPVGAQTLNAVVAGAPPASFVADATPAPPSAATAIAKLSGDMQTVVQHSLLPQPIQVVVTDVLGNPVPGAEVTFSATTRTGYVSILTEITDSYGNAGWTGYFHAAGQQRIEASVAGIATVTFNASVMASDHRYDGRYHCSTPPAEPHFNFDLIVMNGLLSSNNPYYSPTFSGTLNEVDGTFSAIWYDDFFTNKLVGQLLVDSLQQATGAGTYQYRAPGGYTGPVYSWTCDRL